MFFGYSFINNDDFSIVMTSHLNKPAHGCICFVVFNLLCDSDRIRCVPVGPKHIDDCRVRCWTRHRQVWHRTKGDAERLTMWRLCVTITESDFVVCVWQAFGVQQFNIDQQLCVRVRGETRDILCWLKKKTISFVNAFSVIDLQFYLWPLVILKDEKVFGFVFKL